MPPGLRPLTRLPEAPVIRHRPGRGCASRPEFERYRVPRDRVVVTRAARPGAASASADDFQRPVIIAMAVVGMVQTAIHQIADMVSMRDSLVPASGAMDMAGLVTEAVVGNGRTALRVLV